MVFNPLATRTHSEETATMAATAGRADQPPGAHGAASADFLRRLSIADAKVLLERTRQEKEKKTQEMQKMISVRYRDLIESADKIVTMHSAALRLEVALKEMPQKWKQIEATLASTLAQAPLAKSAQSDVFDAASSSEDQSTSLLQRTIGEQVAFIVTVPEKMWSALDKGESFEALELYLQAKEIYESPALQAAIVKHPFLAAQWACAQSFRPRMVARAQTFLKCRGQTSQFYASNLCTLAVLNERGNVTCESLLESFLSSRTAWMEAKAVEQLTEEDGDLAKQEQRLIVMLRTIISTLLHAEDIFLNANQTQSLMVPAFKILPKLQADFQEFTISGKLEEHLNKWVSLEQKKIDQASTQIISRITTIAQLAHVQSKLHKSDKKNGDYMRGKIWPKIRGRSVTSATPHEKDRPSVACADSVFAMIFADAFRKKTRDLVQSSFVEAIDAIKKQIRTSVDNGVQGNVKRIGPHLSCIKFYEYFEAIHKKAENLDASDLQSVLMEEVLRALIKIVVFIEQEYPIHSNRRTPITEGNATGQKTDYYLAIANIFGAIAAGFPSKRGQMFPGINERKLLSNNVASLKAARSSFHTHADEHALSKKSLHLAFQELDVEGNESFPSFIDEELKLIQSMSFHSFYLISEIKRNVSYPQVFINVLQSLSHDYCESWAAAFLRTKIEPLRELLQIEQYDLTNEEWIACHEGWTEQVIVDDALSESGDDSMSESDITMGEERVWLPWCETPTVSSFLFACCHALDEASRLVRGSVGAEENHVAFMQRNIRDVLVEQLTITSVEAYSEAVSLLVRSKASQNQSVLNFGECCILQFLFDMYFVRATLGFSDFIRFGWGDELNPEECSPGLLALLKLFEKMKDFIDPVDWEIYGPQLIENVVIQFRKSRLLFSSLSESNDISEINGKKIIISAQDTRPLARIVEPVSRFSLLPVPSSRRRLESSGTPHATNGSASNGSSTTSTTESLFQEQSPSNGSTSTLTFQNILSGSAGSNILSAAASGTTLLSSAAKGMSYLSSATSSYLREGESRPKYF